MFAFLLIVGAAFYVIATSLTGLVGETLFEQRSRTDRISVEKLAVQLAPLLHAAQSDELYEQLAEAGGQLGGRLMVLDKDGKVQFDTFSQLIGSRQQLPEVLSILMNGQTVDYGVHQLIGEAQTVQETKWFSFFRPLNSNVTWVAYCTAALLGPDGVIGVLLFSSPVQEMMENLYALQEQMIFYFVVVAAIALVVAMVFSRIITRPIAMLTRSIQKMGKGDLSVRVPVKGSGELKRLSETFNTMSEKLETLDQSRNQFVSNASHELKTPLATMKIMLETLIYQPEMGEELRTEFMQDINSEIDRLSLIISDLLTLVQMDTKNTKLHRTNLTLGDVVTQTAHRLSPMAQNKKQELNFRILDACPMYADESKLTQVVYNLMENAVKYSSTGGKVDVVLKKSGRDAILEVTDNGPGIPKEDQSHIFDRFYRVDKARSRGTGGTGLGLSIVHQIVLLHGGEISVTSEEGQGSTFTVILPVHQG